MSSSPRLSFRCATARCSASSSSAIRASQSYGAARFPMCARRTAKERFRRYGTKPARRGWLAFDRAGRQLGEPVRIPPPEARYIADRMELSTENGRLVAGFAGGEKHPIAFAPAEQQSLSGDPSGGTSLVTWLERGVFVRDLLKEGEPLQIVDAAVGPPAISGDATSALVACRSNHNGIIGVLLRDGQPPKQIRLSGRNSAYDAPAVVATGGMYLVFFFEDGLRMSRITKEGVLLDDDGGTKIASSGTNVIAVRGGDVSMVVWETNKQIHAQRFDANGTPIGSDLFLSEGFGTFENHGEAMRPSVTWDGSDFVVIWSGGNGVKVSPLTGKRTAFSLPGSTHPSIAHSAYAAVTIRDFFPNVEVVVFNRDNGTLLNLQRTPGLPPRIMPLPDGRIALYYTELRAEEGFVPRVFARII